MLKIQTDHIIIDGHEPTKEQCETMTLLANALAESNNFKTVEYRDGYAEFERVGHTEELKFWNTDLIVGTLNGETFNISAIGPSVPGNLSISASISATGLQVTLSGNLGGRLNIVGNNAENYFVPWDSTIEYSAGDTANFEFKSGVQLLSTPGALDNDFAITLSAPSKLSVDITTLPGWSSLSTGSHNITIVAKADGYADSKPSSAVTYSIYTIVGTATNCTINGQASYSGTITQGGSITLTLGADGANYKLPTSVTVTGATSNFTRTSDTAGLLVISNPTGSVSFSVVGEQVGITDLTGYIWRPNTTITTPPAPENTYGNTTAFASLTATSSKGSFSVPGRDYGYNFGWDSTNNRYNWLMFTDTLGQKNKIIYFWNYQSKTGWYGYINNGTQSKVTNVSITFNENARMGGSFITFDTFVSWLKANGTLTKPNEG